MTKLTGFLTSQGRQAYFFTGNGYVRYNVAGDCVEADYPKQIADTWSGLFVQDIDAAPPWTDGSVYFFRGAEYIKYDMAADQTVDGYPMSVAGHWSGLFERDIDAALMWPGEQYAYFFRSDEYNPF